MVRLEPETCRKAADKTIQADFVIAGGGLPGTCAAVTAAREGLKVALVQDRSVLGGNASSEVRLWALGATSHMGNNNRWAREGGVIDEIMTENLWRNPEGNPVLFDAVLLDKVWAEPNITLLLDTVVHSLKMEGGKIESVSAYCSPESTTYELKAPLFCDATGDGTLGYLSGASFRVGAEEAGEFKEPLAPSEDYGELLGSTIFFYSKDAGKPIDFVAPDFALKDVTTIPRCERIKATDYGCSFWWLEYGGRLNTIDDAAEIKRELLKVVYGIWNYIKNSGEFPEAENLTLEWVGTIPGKRESRRFEGDYMLTQSDIVQQRRFDDAVSFGGWAIDLHPADGVYSDKAPCNQYHSRGVYQIPYRTLYSRDVSNLFLAGRIISVSHVAFGSTRVMMTGAHNAQAVAVAASLCIENGKTPGDLTERLLLKTLQQRLLHTGQFIPHLEIEDEQNLASKARITVPSTTEIEAFKPSNKSHEVEVPEALLLPFNTEGIPLIDVHVSALENTTAVFELRRSERYSNFSPDLVIETVEQRLPKGFIGVVSVQFKSKLTSPEYLAVTVQPAPGLLIHESNDRYSGILRLRHGANLKVATSAVQKASENSGIDSMEFWLPERRPYSTLWAASFNPPLQPYNADDLLSGYERPFIRANCWSVAAKDRMPVDVEFKWLERQGFTRVLIAMDSDFDHPMESVQFGHDDRVSPFLPKKLQLLDSQGTVLFEIDDIHDSRLVINLPSEVETDHLSIRILEFWGDSVSLFRIAVYKR